MSGPARATGWRPAVLWAILTAVGFGAALQLVDAGTGVRWQHFQPWIIDTTIRRVALLVMALQALAVAVFWLPRLPTIWRSVRDRVRWWQVVVFVGFVVLSSAAPSRDVPAYAAELLTTSLMKLVSLASVAAMVTVLPAGALRALGAWSRTWWGGTEGTNPDTPRIDAWTVGVAVVVTIVCAALAVTVYQRHPHVPDEVSYLLQARYFAEGVLWMPAPPVPEAFDVDLMTYEATRWFSPFPPGWPAILAVGVRLGVPWLLNPLLTGANVILASLLAWALYDKRMARLTVVFLATSPRSLFLGMSLMAHTATMTVGLVAALSVWQLRQGRSLVWAAVGGGALAVAGTIRPLEGLIVAMLLGLWCLGGVSRVWWRRVLTLGALATCSMVLGGLGLWYNASLTGAPLSFPVTTYFDQLYGPGTNDMGFGATQGVGWAIDAWPGHSPAEAVLNVGLNVPLVDVELLGWPIGSLMVVAGFLLWGRLRREDLWLIAVVAGIIVAHSFYWFAGGPDFGARYWYMILLPCLLLTARGVLSLGAWFGRDRQEFDPRPLAAVFALVALTVMVFLPWRASDRYYHYRGMRPDVRVLADRHRFGRSVVLIRGPRAPDYASAAVYNPLDLGAAVPIYVWDRDPATRRAVIEAYGDRPVWIVNGPTESGAGFEVVDGPLDAASLLRTPDSGGGQ